jgi:hypothetical protein
VEESGRVLRRRRAGGQFDKQIPLESHIQRPSPLVLRLRSIQLLFLLCN